MLILNLKNYSEAYGENLIPLLADIENVLIKDSSFREIVYVAPAVFGLQMALLNFPDLNLIAQHTDPHPNGSSTGWIPAQAISDLGVKYTILNHAEHRSQDIFSDMAAAKQAGLKTIVCTESLEESAQVMTAGPDAIALEDSSLIGGGVSIVEEQPQKIRKFAAMCRGKTKPIIGAGIGTGEDIRSGLELGVEGFILASAFVKAENKQQKLAELIAPFSEIIN